MSDFDKAVEQKPAVDGAASGSGPAPRDGAEPAAGGRGPDEGSPGAGADSSATDGPGRQADPPAQAADEAALRGDVDELVAVAAQRDEYLALAQRTQADFENYRKRVAREAAAAQDRGAAALAKELLPALDNLDRALDAAAEDDPLLEGVRLVRSELGASLARCGIESYAPVGEQFDPALHEAVATAPQGDGGAPSGAIVEVYQPGYRLGASIIRPARVLVAA
jgi:molecular chaperone GrpE